MRSLRSTRRSVRRFALALSAAIVLSLVVGGAAATPNFPRALQRELEASATPDCSICHVNGRVGRGTVNTPFGSGMRSRGLVAYDEGALAKAAAAMEADRVDSDGDGVLDVDAIRMGKDPNPVESFVDPTIPRYGCVGSVSPTPPGELSIAFAFLALAWLARRRGRSGPTIALVSFCITSLASCGAPGAALSPRARRSSAHHLAPIRSTVYSADLHKLGLDPNALPRFADLAPWQVQGVMSVFVRSLGYGCTDCHDAEDHAAPTRAKYVTIRMWDDFVRGRALEGGTLFCDSCHQGSGAFLDRSDKENVSDYMTNNYTVKISSRADKATLECGSCHGAPFAPRFLETWAPRQGGR